MSEGRSGAGARADPRLHVERSDPPEPRAPAVVLVHGVLDSARSFARVRRILGESHRTIAYDRRGYQRSRDAGTGAGTLAEHVDDLLCVLEEHAGACASTPAAVLGHSYGGVVALAAAERRPDLVARVVAYEPPLSWLEWPDDPDAVAAARDRVAPAPGETPAAFAERFTRTMLGDARYGRLAVEVRSGLALDGPAASLEVAQLAAAAGFDPARVGVEVVVAHGSDAAPRHERDAAWLARHVPGARLAVVDGAAHGAHLSHPHELAALVDATARSPGHAP
ncbi:MAG TPA: alpha/beta hydrolase [Acidimicrobiales bacterium]|nr:alpha/beta hydrolase [Acidimicrobiales bacterium]